jgi:thymidylate synthase
MAACNHRLFFKGDVLEKQYLSLMKDILTFGEDREDRTGVGTRSGFGPEMSGPVSLSRFPLLTTKYVHFDSVVKELLWFLSGSSDEGELASQDVKIWREWADAETCERFGREAGDLGPVYGPLWRGYPYGPFDAVDNESGRVDQIANLLDGIMNSPVSRRHIVSGWCPYYSSRVALPPCHTLWQVYCHTDGRLSLKLYARSIDLFLGLPFNIASYALLLCMLSQVTDRRPGELYISFGDLHIYSNHFKQCQEQLNNRVRAPAVIDLRMPEGDTPLEKLLNYTKDHVDLVTYSHAGKIPAPVAK